MALPINIEDLLGGLVVEAIEWNIRRGGILTQMAPPVFLRRNEIPRLKCAGYFVILPTKKANIIWQAR